MISGKRRSRSTLLRTHPDFRVRPAARFPGVGSSRKKSARFARRPLHGAQSGIEALLAAAAACVPGLPSAFALRAHPLPAPHPLRCYADSDDSGCARSDNVQFRCTGELPARPVAVRSGYESVQSELTLSDRPRPGRTFAGVVPSSPLGAVTPPAGLSARAICEHPCSL